MREAPAELVPQETRHNRRKRWSDNGIFAQIMAGLPEDRPLTGRPRRIPHSLAMNPDLGIT